MQIGPYTLTTVETGNFGLDGGAMFGVVPKAIWEKTNPADAQNRIAMKLRCLLITKPADSSGPARRILVDCGMGTKWSPKHIEMYGIDHSQTNLEGSLATLGLGLGDITDVILTHLHFDHAGGLTRRSRPGDPQSDLVPTFPGAQVYVQRRNWEIGFKPLDKDRASYLTENYGIYGDNAICGRKLELLDTSAVEPTGHELYGGPRTGEEEILPGISVQVSNGHTLGMQTVKVAGLDPSGKPKSVIYCADLVPTATHVRIPFVMGYDCFPVFLMEEKKILLNRAVDEGSLLFYEHCPNAIATGVMRTPKGDFAATEAVTL